MSELARLTWTDVGSGRLLVVPLGSCEQHGPHLPLDTDTRIAEALAGAAVDRLGAALLAPPITIGASGEHQSFPGTLSIGTEALTEVLVELVRSALPGGGATGPRPFVGVVLVNGHGGNVTATTAAAERLAPEGRAVLAWHPQVAGGDSHAGRTETSLLLHLAPETVRTDRLEVGSTARWRDIRETVVRSGLAAVTENGVLGDPRPATADEGAETFASLVEALVADVDRWRASLSDVTGTTGTTDAAPGPVGGGET